MKRLAGRTAIVTGASAGIGLHIARALAAERMNLVLAARSADKLEALTVELRRAGVQVVAVPTDVTVHEQRERLVETALRQFGQIDVLVNNAGVELFRPYETAGIAEIERTIQTNVTGALVLTRLVLPHMLRSGRGHIVNMSSTAGKHGPAFGAAYGASKAALIAFTQSLRGECYGTGISASVICPGFTDDGGIYERMKQTLGRGTPPQMGGTTGTAVARAVVRAIRTDAPEVILNVPPMRPVFVLAALFPRLGEWVVRRGSHRFLRRIARSHEAAEQTEERRAA